MQWYRCISSARLFRVKIYTTHDVRVAQELDVRSSALEPLLKLDLVLCDDSLALGVEGSGERCRDGMVSGLGLEHQSLISFDAGVDGGLLDGPLADVREDLQYDPASVRAAAWLS